MKTSDNELIKVCTDSEVVVNMFKAELAKIGISSLIKNEFQSAVMAGFGATPNAVELYVNSTDFDEATALIQDFKNSK